MPIVEIVGVIGSVASIGGAVFAWNEAIKSKASASASIKLKSELLNYRKASELSELKPILISARDTLDKYCISSQTNLEGVSKELDAKSVQKVTNKFLEFSSHFSAETVASFSQNIDKELQKFIETDDVKVVKKCGRNMHRELCTLYTTLVVRIKEQQESTVN